MVRLAAFFCFARRLAGLPRITALAVGACLFALAPLASAQMRVAVVDTQRAVMESEDGLRAQATLKKLFDKRQRELDQKQKDLQKEREELEKNRAQINTEAMAKRVENWQREMAQVQAVFVEYNKELQQKQNELTQPIVQKTVGIIRRLATQEGFDLVLERQAATYFRSDLDLTDRVITLYNRGDSAAPAAPAAAPPAAPPPPKK
ncbi:MAG TPA: OmpH family outer membrane protein [Polyangiaceae bacterium]|nr:OmpH family outer membrane protein [Polyangiaceae bacterium]